MLSGLPKRNNIVNKLLNKQRCTLNSLTGPLVIVNKHNPNDGCPLLYKGSKRKINQKCLYLKIYIFLNG